MTYTCTVAWCTFDGRSESALRKHVRTVHPWFVAREKAAQGHFRPCEQCGLVPARHNSNLGRIGDPSYAGHAYR